jgi:regulator of protease activity HflC (stomatin/prohibitin superfamily)
MISCYRGRPEEHTMVVQDGKVVMQGRALNCLVTKRRHVLSVPGACLTVRMSFAARSSDMQPVGIDGDLVYKVVSPSRAAANFDFSVDPKTGAHTSDGPVSLRRAVMSITRDLVRDEVSRMRVESIIGREPTVGRATLIRLRHSSRLRELGVRPMDVFIKELKVSHDTTRSVEERMVLNCVASETITPGTGHAVARNPPAEGESRHMHDGASAGMECTDNCPFRHLCGDYRADVRDGKAWCTLFREFST